MQYINKNTIALAVILVLFCVQGYFIYSLENRVRTMAPVVAEAYNGQNFIGNALYQIGVFDLTEDGKGVRISPNYQTRSQANQ